MKKIPRQDSLLVMEISGLQQTLRQMLELLPEIQKRAFDPALKNALTHYLNLTASHAKATSTIAGKLDMPGKIPGSMGHTTEGLGRDAIEILDATSGKSIADIIAITWIQKIQQFKATCILVALSFSTVHAPVKETLQQMLDEENSDAALFEQLLAAFLKQNGEPEKLDQNAGGKSINDLKGRKNQETPVSPGARSGTSHRGYPGGESRGH